MNYNHLTNEELVRELNARRPSDNLMDTIADRFRERLDKVPEEVSMTIVERYHDISCGHRVFGHESKCAHLHGHNYRIYFRLVSYLDLDEIGVVVDFGVIKERLCEWLEDNWDHRFLLYSQDPWVKPLQALDKTVKIVPFNPTAENMAKYLVEQVGPASFTDLPITLIECRVEETRKCSATHYLQRPAT